MKTVNLTLDETLWKVARAEAGRRDMSVSALMREALERHLRGGRGAESEEESRHRLVDLLEECQLPMDRKPKREDTYGSSRFH